MYRYLSILCAFAILLRRYVHGFPGPHPEGRIIGGSEANIEDYPYMAGLEVRGHHFCGGAIISERHVVTAAHCLLMIMSKPFLRKALVVRVGSSTKAEGGQTMNISYVEAHPLFAMNRTTVDFDVGVITLKKKLQFDSKIKPISLVSIGEKIPAGVKATISGWGRINDQGGMTVQLHVAEVEKIADARCQAMWDTLTHKPMSAPFPSRSGSGVPEGRIILPRNVCFKSLGKGTCLGDSGGPLVVDGKLAGIVSYGVSLCVQEIFPNVYSNIADPDIRDWLEKFIIQCATPSLGA